VTILLSVKRQIIRFKRHIYEKQWTEKFGQVSNPLATNKLNI